MRVKLTANIGHRNQRRQRTARRTFDLIAPLPQFRFNETQPAGAIDVGLVRHTRSLAHPRLCKLTQMLSPNP